jgi:pimeloyl-ACP methyl ester carboxylesterase
MRGHKSVESENLETVNQSGWRFFCCHAILRTKTAEYPSVSWGIMFRPFVTGEAAMFPERAVWNWVLAGIVASIVAFAGLAPGAAHGQVERYELGKRLRRFEEAWQNAAPDARKESASHMQDAVARFFSLNLQGAAEKLDAAWMVTVEDAVEDATKGAIPFRVELSPRLIDDQCTELSASLIRLYPSQSAPPELATVRWEILDPSGQTLVAKESTWPSAIEGISLPTTDLPSGDYRVRVSMIRDQSSCVFGEMVISRVVNLEPRRKRLDELSRDRKSSLDDCVRATIREHVGLIDDLIANRPLETDYPVNQLLALDEAMVDDPNSIATNLQTAAVNQDVWFVLAKSRRSVPVRLRCPPRSAGVHLEDRGLPVLILFHGAGGSENMFFETYGAGGAVRAGLERGWLVIAPRQGLTGISLDCSEMLDVLEKFFRIDREQVYLLGHSMGAGQVIRQATLHPELFRGAAVIGGGSGVRDPQKLVDIGWYVAAGELDFGRRGAKAFQESLQRVQPSRLKYELVPDVEHMVIVQATLQPTFEFFDDLTGHKPR